MLVIKGLVFLAVILAGRFGPMPVDNSLAAVLGNTDGNLRMFFVKPVKPGAVILHFSAVPAKIMVVTFHIRNPVHRAVFRRHGYMGNGGKPGGIHPFAQCIQFLMVFHKLF